MAANSLIYDLFSNIISNSVKYTDGKDVWIDIKIFREYLNIEYITIVISDKGKGIPPEIREIIFDYEKRIKHGWSSTSLGIGTLIINTIIEGFGGKITYKPRIESDWRLGTTVEVRLPEYRKYEADKKS